MGKFNLEVKRKLILFCKENGITQSKLALELGVSANSVNRWFDLRKKTIPSLSVFLFLAEKYKLNINEITGIPQN